MAQSKKKYTKSQRQGLQIKKLATGAKDAWDSYSETRDSEAEKTRKLKERHRKEQNARRRK